MLPKNWKLQSKSEIFQNLEKLEEIILEEIKEIKEIKELEQEEKDKELIQMMNKDIKIITDEIVDEIIENEPSVSIASKSLDDEIVDLSEDIYPVRNQNNSNQNNKGWIKTLLFM